MIWTTCSAQNLPILDTQCNGEHIYNWSEYQCTNCPDNSHGVCRPNSTLQYINASNKVYLETCEYNFSTLVCFDSETVFQERQKTLQNDFKACYYDISSTIQGPKKEEKNINVSSTYLEQYTWAELLYEADPTNQTALALLSNACAVFNYDSTMYPCKKFNEKFTSKIRPGKYDYRFWPQEGPFITYGSTDTLNYISEEDYITTRYDLNDPISFQLARYSQNGDFLGFHPLLIDFQKCGDTNNAIDIWKHFGYNYYSQCYIDLSELSFYDTTDLFDPFIEDGRTSDNKIILRPIPVVIKNYRGVEGTEINRNGKRRTTQRAVRRFFINDNYTSDTVAQYLTSFSIEFNVKDDKHSMYPPIFTLEYTQVYKKDLEQTVTRVKIDEETVINPKFSFQVQYIKDNSEYWQALIILFSIILSIGVIYIILAGFITIRNDAIDGCKLPLFMGMMGNFLDTGGTVVFLIAFSFSLYTFFFYKFQKSTFLFLPPEEDFDMLIPALWIIFGLKLVGIIFIVISKSGIDFFQIDWESPKADDIPISGWRRISVANEWNRLITVRHYSISFTVLALAFIIGGFNLNLLATPIPSTELIEIDKQYQVLRFAFTSFVWLLLILFQFIWIKFIIWPIFGSPFLNFVDLCTTSNISVLIRISSSHGFYIHGKSPTGQTDIELDKMRQNFELENNDLVPKRGLINDTTNQVFEVFFAAGFRNQLNELYNSQLASIGSPSVLGCSKHIDGDNPSIAYEINKDIGEFLKKFLSQRIKEHRFVVQNESILQQLINFSPTVIEETVFSIVGDSRYKKALLAGIEWRIQMFYLAICNVIGLYSDSPCIPVFVIFCIDVVLIKICNLLGRANLAKKALLDDRFFL